MTSHPKELYIGIMSGTSLDGIDLVAVSFAPLHLHASLTVSFPPQLREALLALTLADDNEIERMGLADVALGRLIGTSVNELIEAHHLDRARIRAIGSHGQTIRHRPEGGFTLQIGDPNQIAELTGLPVVADFRRRDMAAGGQGAPLVPAFHQSLFTDRLISRIILNLGGIANISVLPVGESKVYGFDTGPANLLMDAWCLRHTGQPFDRDGAWAASGQVNNNLLRKLLEHEYFSRPYPKSTGREEFNLLWLEQQLQDLAESEYIEDSDFTSDGRIDSMTPVIDSLSPEDVQATLLQLTASSVSQAIAQTGLEGGELWVCGGGAYNHSLWLALQSLLPTWQLHSTAELGLAPTWVEATAFAWLTAQRVQAKPGNLPAVTGATGPRILGGLW